MSVVPLLSPSPALHLNQRRTGLAWLFARVKDWNYVFLKYFYSSLEEIPEQSDLDLIVPKADLAQWKKLLSWMPGLEKIHFSDKSFASYAALYFEDGSYLEIDLIHQIKWKQWTFLPATELIERGHLNEEGIKVGRLADAYCYLLSFYLLNGAAVPTKYQDFFGGLPEVEQLSIRNVFARRFQLDEARSLDLFQLQLYRPHIQRLLGSRPENKGISGLVNRFRWGRDYLRTPKAPTITFSGVDGAGKSTLLELTRKLLTEKYRQEVVMRRQRPSILPILSSFKYGKEAAETRAANTLPRQGGNQSRLSSLVRFAYYLVDYLLGQHLVAWKYNQRGRLLLYDRYYFDYIVDSKRANLTLSANFTRFFYRWIHKPELNILLYADPEVIISRKQELSETDIRQLTNDFLGLFNRLGQQSHGSNSIYLPIHNLEIEATMAEIEKHLRHILHKL